MPLLVCLATACGMREASSADDQLKAAPYAIASPTVASSQALPHTSAISAPAPAAPNSSDTLPLAPAVGEVLLQVIERGAREGQIVLLRDGSRAVSDPLRLVTRTRSSASEPGLDYHEVLVGQSAGIFRRLLRTEPGADAIAGPSICRHANGDLSLQLAGGGLDPQVTPHFEVVWPTVGDASRLALLPGDFERDAPDGHVPRRHAQCAAGDGRTTFDGQRRRTRGDTIEALLRPCACASRETASFDAEVGRLMATLQHSALTHDSLPTLVRTGIEPFALRTPRVAAAEQTVARLLALATPGEAWRLQVDSATSPSFRVFDIRYHGDYIHGSQQAVLVQSRGSATWYVVYNALVSSKAFTALELRGFSSPERLEVSMCSFDCGWWGSFQDAELDLRTLALYVKPER